MVARDLVVHRISLTTATALEQIGLGATLLRHLVVVNSLLGKLGSEVLHVIACHLVWRHDSEPTRQDHSQQHVLTQPRVTRVLRQHTYSLTMFYNAFCVILFFMLLPIGKEAVGIAFVHQYVRPSVHPSVR